MEEQQATGTGVPRGAPLARGGGPGSYAIPVAGLLLALAAGWGMRDLSRLDSPPTPTPRPSSAPTTVKDLTKQAVAEAGKTLIQSKKGRQWLLEASKVKWSDVGKKAHVDTVDWTLKSPKGDRVVALRAPGADVFVDQSRVQFQGMVDTYRFSTGDHVLGRDLMWDGKKSLLVGNHGVRWTKGVTVITADHMTASDRLERIHLQGNVKITTLVNETKAK